MNRVRTGSTWSITSQSRVPCAAGVAMPRLGEHSDEILREAGYSDGEIELVNDGGACLKFD